MDISLFIFVILVFSQTQPSFQKTQRRNRRKLFKQVITKDLIQEEKLEHALAGIENKMIDLFTSLDELPRLVDNYTEEKDKLNIESRMTPQNRFFFFRFRPWFFSFGNSAGTSLSSSGNNNNNNNNNGSASSPSSSSSSGNNNNNNNNNNGAASSPASSSSSGNNNNNNNNNNNGAASSPSSSSSSGNNNNNNNNNNGAASSSSSSSSSGNNNNNNRAATGSSLFSSKLATKISMMKNIDALKRDLLSFIKKYTF